MVDNKEPTGEISQLLPPSTLLAGAYVRFAYLGDHNSVQGELGHLPDVVFPPGRVKRVDPHHHSFSPVASFGYFRAHLLVLYSIPPVFELAPTAECEDQRYAYSVGRMRIPVSLVLVLSSSAQNGMGELVSHTNRIEVPQ